jgi:hypothetical protein
MAGLRFPRLFSIIVVAVSTDLTRGMIALPRERPLSTITGDIRDRFPNVC